MAIVLNCPGCGKRYEIESALAGKKSRCKQCGAIFRIPADGREDAAAPPVPEQTGVGGTAPSMTSSSPARSASPSKSSGGEERISAANAGYFAPRAATREPATPAAGTIVINCPGCGKHYELASALAGKKSRCRQCGEVFTIAVALAEASEPATSRTMLERPKRRAAAEQAIAESHWESVLADDSGAPPANLGTRLNDDGEFGLPDRPRPGAPKRGSGKKAGRPAGDSSLGFVVCGWFMLTLLVLFGGAFGAGAVGLLAQSQVRYIYAGAFLITMIGCGALMLWGLTWLVLVAFREELRCGIMFLVVPFYAFYYILTRLAATKGPASMVLTSYGVIAIVAAVGPALERSSRPGADDNQAASIAAALGDSTPGPEPINPPGDGFAVPGRNRIPVGPGQRKGAPRGGGASRGLAKAGPRPKFLDRLGRQLDAIASRYGNRAIVLAFTGIPANSDPAQGVTGRDVWEAITKRVKTLAPAIEAQMSYSIDNRRVLIVAPIDDPAALASRIDFGRATANGTKIGVDVSPEFVASVPRQPPERR